MSLKKTKTENSLTQAFGNRVRVRVCGLLFSGEKLLLIKHNMGNYNLWAPPGGGVEFGESVTDTLVREFKEETGITVEAGDFLFINEHIVPPLHAIEVFYLVSAKDLSLSPGREPELGDDNIFEEFKFVGTKELQEIPVTQRHSLLQSCTNPIELLDKRGHLK